MHASVETVQSRRWSNRRGKLLPSEEATAASITRKQSLHWALSRTVAVPADFVRRSNPKSGRRNGLMQAIAAEAWPSFPRNTSRPCRPPRTPRVDRAACTLRSASSRVATGSSSRPLSKSTSKPRNRSREEGASPIAFDREIRKPSRSDSDITRAVTQPAWGAVDCTH